jgi:hypothetical protein
VLTPGEIRILLEGLKVREKTLISIATSTGIRQSELFALGWGDINFSAGIMNVARSIVHSFVGTCKTGSDAGGRRAAILYSLLGTARMNGIDPEVYLCYVLARIAEHPIKHIEELQPLNVARNLAPVSPRAA